jgi:hypothetical protein
MAESEARTDSLDDETLPSAGKNTTGESKQNIKSYINPVVLLFTKQNYYVHCSR